MAILHIPHRPPLTETAEIQAFLSSRGIPYQQWPIEVALPEDPTQESILATYSHQITPYMATQGYQTADVIQLNASTPNLAALRAKFLKEHTHTEDEVRFFVQGHGDFWYHLSDEPDGAFGVRATAGDLLAVPANVKHWFDAGDTPDVTVIRMFSDPQGWEAHYTGSSIANSYAWPESPL